jgi:N-acetylmuramoyl-L-alanine amidase
MKKRVWHMAFLCLMVWTVKVQAVELIGANVTKTPAGVMLQLDLPANAGVEYTSKLLSADPANFTSARFFVDFSPLTLSKKFQPPAYESDSQIKKIRWAQHEKNKVRVVFDLASTTPPPFMVEKNIKGIMISTTAPVEVPTMGKVAGKDNAPAEPSVGLPTPVVVAPVEKIEVKKQEPVISEAPKVTSKNSIAQTSLRKIRIILDAGHGGDDPGAIGKKGTMEKDVTLDVAMRTKQILLKDSKYDVYMTRENDSTLQLLDRTKFANKMNGDLFVSIHANASPRREAKGVSTYFLNNADDQESLRVAMRENGELDPAVLHQHSKNTDDYYLEVMKASMVKNFHTTQSTDLARAVQTDLLKTLRKEYSDVHDLGVRSARFYVLTGATMPAILVETSFISNPTEEKRLSDSKYQQALAKAVVGGIESFFKNRPAFDDSHSGLISEQVSRKSNTRKN